MNFNLSVPINSTSFGACSYNILKELYNRGLSPNIFPIGGVDLSSFDKVTQDFGLWLQSCINKGLTRYSRHNPEFRLWHIMGSESSHSNEQSSLVFQETDALTPVEKNILANQKNVFVTSNYTKRMFENHGLTNVTFLPLGYDGENFPRLNNKHPYDNKVVTHGIFGKIELRKSSQKLISLWVKKFGNNPNHKLHLHTFNSFLHQDPAKCQEINKQLILQCFGGQNIWNVNVINGHLKTSSEYNALLQSVDIVLDGSANENWSIPSFSTTCNGKHLVAVRANGIAEWANDDNAVLVEPTGKEDSSDGIFFQKGNIINQGNFLTWNEEDYSKAMDKALERFQANPINEAGLQLQDKFKWSKTVDIILDKLQ